MNSGGDRLDNLRISLALSYSGFNASPRVNVIMRSAHHQSECQVLALGIEYSVRRFGVDVPGATTHSINGTNPPVTLV